MLKYMKKPLSLAQIEKLYAKGIKNRRFYDFFL